MPNLNEMIPVPLWLLLCGDIEQKNYEDVRKWLQSKYTEEDMRKCFENAKKMIATNSERTKYTELFTTFEDYIKWVKNK